MKPNWFFDAKFTKFVIPSSIVHPVVMQNIMKMELKPDSYASIQAIQNVIETRSVGIGHFYLKMVDSWPRTQDYPQPLESKILQEWIFEGLCILHYDLVDITFGFDKIEGSIDIADIL